LKRPVLWSENALRELNAAIAYIAIRNPTAARRMVADLRSAGDRLGLTPTGRPGRVPGTYEKTVSRRPYIIVYAIDAVPADGERVIILRVIHTSRRWPPGQWPK
jgi:toxin ParE1/3/4